MYSKEHHLTRYNNRELWLALLAMLLISLLYGFVVVDLKRIPPASDFFGHMIGVVGFILMLATETLYSLRKRSRSARWGRMSTWLSFHIFTGIVGPYMVLLHTSWKFNGLAGAVTLMTLIVVASGFIGRYIYTSIPRTADGFEAESGAIESEIAAIQATLQTLGATQISRIKALQKQQAALRRQAASLATARRMLSLWHTVHIPIGMALFATAFVHIFAALYYATFLH
jgi:hypothetical protein